MGMTMKEFSEATGVSLRTIRHYCNNGKTGANLFPLKGDNPKGGNHRCFEDADLERMEMILIYRKIGLSYKEIRELLDRPNYDSNEALVDALVMLRKRIRHLENIEYLAMLALGMGTNIFSFGSMDDDEIDQMIEVVSKEYGLRDQIERNLSMSREEVDQASFALIGVIRETIRIMEEADYSNCVERVNNALRQIHSEYAPLLPEPGPNDLLVLAEAMRGNGLIRQAAIEVGGDDGPAKAMTCLHLSWYSVAAPVFEPIVYRLANGSKEEPSYHENMAMLRQAIKQYGTQDATPVFSGLGEGFYSYNYSEGGKRAFAVLALLSGSDIARSVAGLAAESPLSEDDYLRVYSDLVGYVTPVSNEQSTG